MGFGKLVHKAIRFGSKMPSQLSKVGNKVIHGAEKGIGVAGNILEFADKAAGALERVPVVGELAGVARPFIKQGEGVLRGANVGLGKAQRITNKIDRMNF